MRGRGSSIKINLKYDKPPICFIGEFVLHMLGAGHGSNRSFKRA